MSLPFDPNDERTRIRAALVNTGKYSFDEADRKLARSCVNIDVCDDAVDTPAGQAAFLSAVATAARCFGNVSVRGRIEMPLGLPIAAPLRARTLGEAAERLGAKAGLDAPKSCRRIVLGGEWRSADTVCATWNGWSLSVGPQASQSGRSDVSLTGVAAGALAVGQAFLAEQGDVRVERTTVDMSLWEPERPVKTSSPGPLLTDLSLPSQLWLVGLGNLGQAYLWSLSMLSYATPHEVLLFLQDDDSIKKENWGTSLLADTAQYGALKTKLAENWATALSFGVRRIDRRLDETTQLRDGEPTMALVGLDKMAPRRTVGRVGFAYIIDAGLGATVDDYRKFRLNAFDRELNPEKHFRDVSDDKRTIDGLVRLPAYQTLANAMNDGGCGAAVLAGQAVAVPFVSAFVGALALTQAIRVCSGNAHHLSVTGDTGDLSTIRATRGTAAPRPFLLTTAVRAAR